jgi:hypothetical protein
MISIVDNETQKAIEIFLDEKGADLLINTLYKLKAQGDHLHLYATNDDRGVSMKSPYPFNLLFGELILTMLPSEAWSDTAE